MNLKSLLVLSVVFLMGCGSPSVRGDLPANDLDALESSVNRDLKPRLLTNGKEYCAELARTEREKDDCTGELEDSVFANHRDKARAKATLKKGIARLKLARNPCKWYQLTCKRQAAALDAP